MSSQPAPTAAPEPPPKPVPPPADAPPLVPDPTAPKPAEEGAIFHALLDAGVEAKLAYTAEKRMHSMTSETVAEHTRPILEEVRQLAEMVRDLTGEVRNLAKAEAEQDRKLDELAKAVASHDRKLDVLAAQMRLMIGAFGLLITALIAVFGILFTR
ncbi:MAG: hypothetical protein F4Z12_09010 [Acidobacteria bacterium]|nr:hypothetical protein [Acidobacteriota bacterium]MYI97074.1 hypothetical protein [Acidobacteriota bacterium]